MSFLITIFVKNSDIYAKIYLILLKNLLKQTSISFNKQFRPGWEDGKKSYQENQFLALFPSIIALISCYNSVKGLRVNKTVKEIIFERVRIELESKKKKSFRKEPFAKFLKLTIVFMWNSTLREKFKFHFSEVFCWY